MLNNVSDIFSSQKQNNEKKNLALKMIRAREVCNLEILRSIQLPFLDYKKQSDVNRDFPADLVVQT
jgi:hypothetical protein